MFPVGLTAEKTQRPSARRGRCSSGRGDNARRLGGCAALRGSLGGAARPAWVSLGVSTRVLAVTLGAYALGACSANDRSPMPPRGHTGGAAGAPIATSGGQGGGALLPTQGGVGGGQIVLGQSGQSGLSGERFECPTSLSGTVYDPAGRLPLYNVVVYVPSEPLAPIPEGAGCQTCDGNFSGRPIAAALSDAKGEFKLALDQVPRSEQLPLVIQIGKWRREIVVENVVACQDTRLPAGTVRLPRDRSEGNLPRIAMVRGGSDTLECLFRKIGIADSEFTTDTGPGRIHLYVTDFTDDPALTGKMASGETLPLLSSLLTNPEKLMAYDVAFLGCDGEGRGTAHEMAVQFGPETFSNLYAYADRGGRIFGSHYQSYWVRTEKFKTEGVQPYPNVLAHPSSEHDMGGDVIGDVNASFPKGQAFRDWLVAVGASTVPGKLPITGGEHFTDAAVAGVSLPWITVSPDPSGHTDVVQYLSFTTPVGQPECGRMVFSDLHVGYGQGDNPEAAFPNGCVSRELLPQEKALAFMLFDLSSCVQPEAAPVIPPIIVR